MARVFMTTYGLYNDGRQFASVNTGFWCDVEKMEWPNVIARLRIEDPDPEPMATDYEDFPRCLYCESISEEAWEIIRNYAGLSDQEKIGFEFLMDRGIEGVAAIQKANEVTVFHGTEEEYAEQFVDECYNIDKMMGGLSRYFDYEKYARDLVMGGDIVEIESGVWCTNPNEF